MTRYMTTVACLLASFAAFADPASTLKVLQRESIVLSAQVQGGAGVVVIGPHFFNSDFNSQQVISGTLLSYLQGQASASQSPQAPGPSVQQFTLQNPDSSTAGTYSNGVLTLGPSQP